MRTQLSKNIVKSLKEYQYLTRRQLCQLNNSYESNISKAVGKLSDSRIVEINNMFGQKSVLRAGLKADDYLAENLKYRNEWHSPAKIHQIVNRNEVIIELKKENPDARLVARPYLYKLGLYPSIGEHCIWMNNQMILLMVDDYGFPSKRIERSWTRKHKQDMRYFSIESLREQGRSFNPYWSAHADKMLIAVFSEKQKKKHLRFIDRNKLDFEIDIVFFEKAWEITP